ncbi:MAG TPA: GvpL/GvpF family gas vesicle protein [Thermoanaerobaculia bacterium]|jgi:hypothetical protein
MKSLVVGIHLHREDIHVDAIAAGDLWLSVVPLADDRPLADRDLLLHVAKIRGELLDRATFIAVRYGTVVPPLQPLRPEWRNLLGANRANVEMTLKVAAPSPKPRPRREDFENGAAYLHALHDSTAIVDDPFRQAAERAFDAIETRWQARDNASLEMAALIPRARIEEIFTAGEQLKRDFPRIPFLLSGPWPLEVFANADQQ